MTSFELQLRVFAWQWNLNKSWSPSYVEQTLFNDQELDQLGNKSNRGHKIEFAVVFNTSNYSKSVSLSNDVDIPRSPNFAKQLELVQK